MQSTQCCHHTFRQAPMIFGTLSDRIGRRLIFIACLLILSLSCVGLALTPTSDYWLLLLLRCIQASGSASTIALGISGYCVKVVGKADISLGAGVIGDISVSAERGGFFGLYSVFLLSCAKGQLLSYFTPTMLDLGPLV